MTSFVNGLLKNRVESGSFKNHLRHFLIQSEEYSIRVLTFSSQMIMDLLSISNFPSTLS